LPENSADVRGKVPAHGEVQTHDGVARLNDGRYAAMLAASQRAAARWLLGAEERLHAVARQIFDDIGIPQPP